MRQSHGAQVSSRGLHLTSSSLGVVKPSRYPEVGTDLLNGEVRLERMPFIFSRWCPRTVPSTIKNPEKTFIIVLRKFLWYYKISHFPEWISAATVAAAIFSISPDAFARGSRISPLEKNQQRNKGKETRRKGKETGSDQGVHFPPT